jgi:4-hydroxybenzoate polyprenyltransferase
MRLLYLLLKTARPRQWIKNAAIYAALIFSGFLFYVPGNGQAYFWTVSLAFVVFCFLTSCVYIFNDIFDRTADQQHPFKRKRPIASGELKVPIAIFAGLASLSVAFFLSLNLTSFFRV